MVATLVEKTKAVNFFETIKVIQDSLSLEDDCDIEWDTKLKDLGAEPIEVLDIFYKLGIRDMKYCSGEKINSEGKERLWDMFQQRVKYSNGLSKNLLHMWNLASQNTTNGFINELSVGDLTILQN